MQPAAKKAVATVLLSRITMATYMCKLAFSNEIVKNIMDIDKSSLGVVKGWFTCYKIPKCSQLGFS